MSQLITCVCSVVFFPMISFKLTFLFSFAVPSPKSAKVKKKRKEKGDKKSKNSSKTGSKKGSKKSSKKGSKKSSKKGKSGKVKSPKEVKLIEIPKYALKVGNIVGSVRLSYELLPKLLKYRIEVLCWENIAKVSTSDGMRYHKTIKKGKNIWIPVTVHHYLKDLMDKELLVLHRRIINIAIRTRKKGPKKGINEFYCYEKDAELDEFVEYFENDPNLNTKKSVEERRKQYNGAIENEMKDAISKCLNSDVGNVSSWMRFTGATHCHKVYETISCISNSGTIEHNKFIPTCIPYEKYVPSDLNIDSKAKGKKKGKKGKKEKKKKGKKKGKSKSSKGGKKKKLSFQIPGEIFFTDPKLAIFKLNGSDGILLDGYVYLTVQNLLTREQKLNMNPLIIKTRKLTCLPATVLKDSGFTHIYVSYHIPYLAKCKTVPMPVEETINFSESHVFFCSNVPKIKFLEYFLTQRVVAEIRGIRNRKHGISKGKLFGSDAQDRYLSDRLSPTQSQKILNKRGFRKEVILAVASYDVSSIVQDVWFFRENALCHNPSSKLYNIAKPWNLKLVDILTVNEANIRKSLPIETSPLSESTLCHLLTSLDMELYFISPQFATACLSEYQNTYKRTFIIILEQLFAQELMTLILNHNEEILGLDTGLPDLTKQFARKAEETQKTPAKKKGKKQIPPTPPPSQNDQILEEFNAERDILTGFSVDNGRGFLIYVEGISHGCILKIWNRIHLQSRDIAKAFFNSERTYENRLYQDFKSIGMFNIILKQQLEDIWEKEPLYLEGNVPIPCFKAIQKLNLLIRTSTTQDMFQYNLFPTTDELLSFNIEFGVPLRMISGCGYIGTINPSSVFDMKS